MDSGHPGPRPAGALRASQIAPGDFVEPAGSNPTLTSLQTAALQPIKIAKLSETSWRRGWDSNPRTRLGVTHFPGVRLRPLGHLSESAARVPERTRTSKFSRCWTCLKGPACSAAEYPGTDREAPGAAAHRSPEESPMRLRYSAHPGRQGPS